MESNEDALPRYASAATLAKWFDVSPSTIWRWADSGNLPKPIKFSPGVTRWRSQDALDAIEAVEVVDG